MTGWVVRKFGGTVPRLTPRALPDNNSQAAANIILTAGSLRPLQANVPVETLLSAGPVQAIHRFGIDLTTDGNYWFEWDFDADCVRGQIYGDTTERTFFTGTGLSTPMFTDNSIALTGTGPYPRNAYILGVPTPTSAPTYTVSGNGFGQLQSVPVATGGVYSAPPTVSLSAPNGTDGGQVQATASVIMSGTAVGSIQVTNQGAEYTSITATLVGGTYTTAATLGTPVLVVTAVPETRVYVYTFVDAYGDEGSASPPTANIDVIPGQTVTLTLPSAPPTVNYNFTGGHINVYRSVVGSSGQGTYIFVASVPFGTTTYADSATDSLIAANGAMTSLGNVPPPAAMLGIVNMPNGMMAGFDSGSTGRDVYFCSPYKPYAWPVANSMTVDYKIVGLGVFDYTLVVLTQGPPFLITGSDPTSMVMTRADCDQACVSKRSIVEIGGGVIYASPEGLYLASPLGFRNLTEQLFTKVEWAQINPSTLQGFSAEGKYIGFYNGTAGFMLDLTTGDYMPLNWFASAGYYEAKFFTLYLVVNGTQLVRFNQGANMPFTWQSKDFYSPHPVSMSCARVEAAAYPVTAYVYADGSLVSTQSVVSSEPYRLPGGFLANTWSMEVASSEEVYSLGLAQSILELENG